MASFVMIHGAWHGGWAFEPLRARIEAAGHSLTAPDLPGMGGDDQALANVTLDDWAAFAVGQCRAARRDGPVLLCGHSRGGIVLSQAAERDPEAMDMLVYICAMLIPTGMSRAEFQKGQVPNPDFHAIIRPTPGRRGTWIDTERAAEVFAQLSPDHLVADALGRLAAEPDLPRATPLSLTPERFGSVLAIISNASTTGPCRSTTSAACRRSSPATRSSRWTPTTAPSCRRPTRLRMPC